MKFVIYSMLFIISLSGSVFSQAAKFVLPTKNNVGVYSTEVRKVNQKASFFVNSDERLQIIKKGRNAYFVKTDTGKKGWIEKRLVVATSGKKFLFDDAEVIGYLDNPTPVYIMDADAKDATPIKLDRSFAEALKENIDKETVEQRAK